ncbi:MAG TPA: response regulator [Marinagarivorans sp.]
MNRVLIIDDDRFTQNVLSRSLCKHYQTRTADNGAMGLRVANSWKPDIILLDVEMPGQNGYEVCDQLKHQESTRHIPVVFLSGKSSLRERMLGFEVGADDYLIKPCEPEFLQQKLSKVTDIYTKRANLSQNAWQAEQTALEAMSTSFELGKAVRFVEHSYSIRHKDTLAQALLEVTVELGLKCSVMFATKAGVQFYGSNAVRVSPIEEDLIKMMHSEQRFVDFGCRTLVNYPQVALLVKNMPLEDRPRYGRIKDTLPFVLGACDAKVRILDAEMALKSQNEHLTRSAVGLEKLLQHVSATVSQNQANVRAIMLDLTTELSLQLHKLGLEGDQEDYVLKQVDRAANRLHDEANSVDSVEHALNTMVKLLQILSAEQTRIIEENLTSTATKSHGVSQDVELF